MPLATKPKVDTDATGEHQQRSHTFECCLPHAGIVLGQLSEERLIEFSERAFTDAKFAALSGRGRLFNYSISGPEGLALNVTIEKDEDYSVFNLVGSGSVFVKVRDHLVDYFYKSSTHTG